MKEDELAVSSGTQREAGRRLDVLAAVQIPLVPGGAGGGFQGAVGGGGQNRVQQPEIVHSTQAVELDTDRHQEVGAGPTAAVSPHVLTSEGKMVVLTKEPPSS